LSEPDRVEEAWQVFIDFDVLGLHCEAPLLELGAEGLGEDEEEDGS